MNLKIFYFLVFPKLDCKIFLKKSIPEESEIKSLTLLTNEQFGNIILKIGRKLKSLRGIDFLIPEYYGKDLNSKYKDSQLIVEFMKKLGYKADMNINNILFPSQRDTQRILEFLIEQLSNSDANAIDINENLNEKNFIKYKVSQKFANWAKEAWILPEIVLETNSNGNLNISKRIIKYDNSKIQSFRKKIKTMNLNDESNLIDYLFKIHKKINLVKTLFSKKSKQIIEDEKMKLITEDEYKVFVNTNSIDETNNYLIKKISKLSKLL